MTNDNQYKGNWSELSLITDNNAFLHLSFDFWNTIAFSNPIFKTERAKVIHNLLNKEYTTEQINQAFYIVGQEYNKLIESGSRVLPIEKLYEDIFKFLGSCQPVDVPSLIQEVQTIFLKHPPIIQVEFLEYLNSISKKGITCSITSNTTFITGATIRKFLTNLGLLEEFDFCIFSDENEFGKPHYSLFEFLFNETKKHHKNI